MSRLNIFETIPVMGGVNAFNKIGGTASNGFLMLHGIVLPGSISLNTLAFIVNGVGTTAKTLSLSFGLYSMNGASLSLANSGSTSTNPAVNMTSWLTLSMSATQDITPGNWYFAVISATAGQSGLFLGAGSLDNFVHAAYGGKFVHGFHSVTQTDVPASVATSDLVFALETADAKKSSMAYILISA